MLCVRCFVLFIWKFIWMYEYHRKRLLVFHAKLVLRIRSAGWNISITDFGNSINAGPVVLHHLLGAAHRKIDVHGSSSSLMWIAAHSSYFFCIQTPSLHAHGLDVMPVAVVCVYVCRYCVRVLDGKSNLRVPVSARTTTSAYQFINCERPWVNLIY